jgi:hypothetical protein
MINNKIGWAGCGLNRVLATKDGDNWFYQYSPSNATYSVNFVESLTGWGGTSMLVLTTDGGGLVGISSSAEELPKYFELFQNYPNPFNPVTVISYQLIVSSYVKLKVYNINGKEIAELVNQRQSAGEYRSKFDGSGLSSGTYFYKIEVSDEETSGVFSETKKMILIR